VEPADEYLHPVEDDPGFSESVYANFADASVEAGGFVRVGNRPNERRAEATFSVFLPDGHLAFAFARPEIQAHRQLDAGGVRYEVLEPFRATRFRYRGRVGLLQDPRALVDPGRALRACPWKSCDAELTLVGHVDPHGGARPDDGSADNDASPFQDFARGHFEQHVVVDGQITIGDERYSITGFGLRDHSWGPRSWHAPLWYRWLTATFDARNGFAITVAADTTGGVSASGVLLVDGSYEQIIHAAIDTQWSEDHYPQRIRARVETSTRDCSIVGEVQQLVPLRHRARGDAEQTTRIVEALTVWRHERFMGPGIAEYLDRLVNGVPASLDRR
jgi:hypothetical protein